MLFIGLVALHLKGAEEGHGISGEGAIMQVEQCMKGRKSSWGEACKVVMVPLLQHAVRLLHLKGATEGYGICGRGGRGGGGGGVSITARTVR